MARSTLTLLFVLGTISSLLVGINIGKKFPTDAQVLSVQDALPSPTATPSDTPTPTRFPRIPSPQPSISAKITTQTNVSIKTANGISTLTDRGCGISIRFPESFVRQKTENANSKIFTDPDRPDEMIVIVCQDTIPEPPVPPENVEPTTLAGVSATLYHDQQQDGSPRDEIIARHPALDLDVIIAGWGPAFDEAVSSFTFLQ